MAKGKQGRQNKTDGQQFRKESKDERKARLERQAKAREACEKILPYAGGVIFFFLLVFAIYVRSMPLKEPKVTPPAATTTAAYQGETPEYFNTDTKPTVNEAMDEAEKVVKDLPKDGDYPEDKSNVGSPEL